MTSPEIKRLFSCDRCNKIFCNDRIGASIRYPTDSVICIDCMNEMENEL